MLAPPSTQVDLLPMSDVTRILSQIESGDPSSAEQLLPIVYDELRKLAAARMAVESPDHTLHPTALVHEAYVRLVEGELTQRWDSRGHFFAAAAEAMRRILVEHARKKGAQKRGGDRLRWDIDAVDLAVNVSPSQLLVLDESLQELAELDETAAQLVKLRYFGGLGLAESAQSLGISQATAYRHWSFARAWLHSRLLADETL